LQERLQQINESYGYLFAPSIDGGGDNEFSSIYGVYGLLYQVANGDITKFEEITEMPASKALTALNYKAGLNAIEIRRAKQMNR